MKNIILLLALTSTLCTTAQEVTNVVFVASDGRQTDNIEKAASFVIVKNFPDHYERLDYKIDGPLTKSRSYKDPDLTILHGNYYQYQPNGNLQVSGKYEENKKCDYWRSYNDSGKVTSSVKYENDVPVDTVDLNKKDEKDDVDAKEAGFPGGLRAWKRYLSNSMSESIAFKNRKGGTVKVAFTIGLEGEVKEMFLMKSASLALDESATKIIQESPKWNAALKNGQPVIARMIQPLTLAGFGM